MYDRILVAAANGLDGEALIPHGVAIAERFDALLDVLMVVPRDGGPYRFDISDVDDLNEAATALQEDLEAELDVRDVSVSVSIRRGDPPRVIESYAVETGVDLIIRHASITDEYGDEVTLDLEDPTEFNRPTLLIPVGGVPAPEADR